MGSKREQALVGLFVLVAAGLLIFTVFLLSGSVSRNYVPYHAYFKNAGGLGPGSEVRYSGGPPVGRVEKVTTDTNDPARMIVDFSVAPDLPIKTDSAVQITSNSPLGDNFLGIIPGTTSAAKAPRDSILRSKEYVSFSDITGMIGDLSPTATTLLNNLNDRVVDLKETLNRVNDLLDDSNRTHIAGTLTNLDGMLGEDRPMVRSTLNNVNALSAKLTPLIDNFHKTSDQANVALNHLDAALQEDRPDLHEAVASLRQALATANLLTDQLNNTLNANSENLDEIIENLRHISDNMNEFTETIKTRPYTLIRASGIKPRKPGEAPPK